MIVYMAKINVVLAKHKHMTATQKVPTKFMDHIAVDLEGKNKFIFQTTDIGILNSLSAPKLE